MPDTDQDRIDFCRALACVKLEHACAAYRRELTADQIETDYRTLRELSKQMYIREMAATDEATLPYEIAIFCWRSAQGRRSWRTLQAGDALAVSFELIGLHPRRPARIHD